MKWYNNMKIRTKLLTGFIIVAIIAGVVGTIGVVNLKNTDTKYSDLYVDYGIALGKIADASISYQKVRLSLRDLVLSDSSEQDKYIQNIDKYNTEMQNGLNEFKQSLKTKESKELFTELNKAIEDYKPYEEAIINAVKAGNNEEAIKTIKSPEAAKVVLNISNIIDQLFTLKDTNGTSLSNQYTSNTGETINVMIIFVICAIAFAIALGIIISMVISKPINKLVHIAQKVSDGDLDVEITSNSKDEIGTLTLAFRKMTDNLNEVMANIANAAEQVSAGSTQLSDSSMALSQGATEQASSIEELSASIEEIASQTRINAENAKEANEITETAKDSAMIGNHQMLEMLKAMEEINEASSNISKIIKVIDDIAFQTNILALNAAVEAARAGQHGKGFAVVAEEVRNLAARSANAAKETTAMIEGSVKKVEGGTKIANETATALNKIVEGITSVASLISSIANASNEQAIGIEQINQGILQVSQVVQTNSATSEESAAASEELASQAFLLESQVSKFKLKRMIKNNYYGDTDQMYHKNSYENKKVERMSHNQSEEKRNSKNIYLSDNEFGKY